MMRMIGRTGLVTMMRAAGTAVLAVGVAATAFAADPVGGVAPVAKPLTTAASLLVTPDDTATPDKKEEGQDPAAANPVVEFFNLETGKITTIAKLNKPLFKTDPGLAVSPDEKSLLIVQIDQKGSDIMLMENFR